MKCATISIVNWQGVEVLNRKILYKPGEFVADRAFQIINGFTATSFLDGTPFEEVRRDVIKILKGGLCILCGGKNDLSSLEIDKNSLLVRKEIFNPKIEFYDLQDHFWYYDQLLNNLHQKYPHSLRSLVSYYFEKRIQTSFHSSSTDAYYTLELFKKVYCTEPRFRMNPNPSDDIPRLRNPLKNLFGKKSGKRFKK